MREEIDKIKELAKKELTPDFFENHVKLVVKEAKWLLKFYPEADEEVVEAACWLHDIVHPSSGYKGDDHNVASAKRAEIFLREIGVDDDKIKKIIHCIMSHRTSRPPEPETIEAKIVASSDNLSHFDGFDYLVKKRGREWAENKIKKDLKVKFMLPEAIEYAKKKMKEIKR